MTKPITTLFISTLMILSCLKEKTQEVLIDKSVEPAKDTLQISNPKPTPEVNDKIIISKKHKPNSISLDLDGDGLKDVVNIVQNIENQKYGLEILFGNKKVDYLGMGKDIANQGIDDIDWVGIFEVASKNEIYYNNVSDDGEILTEDQVKESDKIKLPNDGIFIHQAESCGGGVIYLKNGKYEWIQQE
ncbi:hypothetical protein [Epilithonimonas xixisoli]|uniref:Uncharacterized protein n=1 Tax=Epilithonimonas xixisoli TaxID=1476462 RepID=A0A4R8IHT8_9FLAO|nr:hypothetical protein [Epilithonimonas xixisoli]TDX86445.1 hypothetical protein B0I22_0570 [Epilithonimonas xixisoli]